MTAPARIQSARSFDSLRRRTRSDTYHVTAIWPDGDVLTHEGKTSREGAYETAEDLMHRFGCTVEILRIHRSPLTGGPIGVSDVTAAFHEDRSAGMAVEEYQTERMG